MCGVAVLVIVHVLRIALGNPGRTSASNKAFLCCVLLSVPFHDPFVVLKKDQPSLIREDKLVLVYTGAIALAPANFG